MWSNDKFIMHFSFFFSLFNAIDHYITKLQGATYILQKVNWGKASENNILQVCVLKAKTRTRAFAFLYTLSLFILTRDGVSEGQFYQVLLYELNAIRKVSI